MAVGAGSTVGTRRPLDLVAVRVAALSDSVDLADGICRSICILSAGAIKINDGEGTTVVIPTGLALGVWHPIRAKRIWSTGTTVTAANVLIGY
jgi:hypothetical protein